MEIASPEPLGLRALALWHSVLKTITLGLIDMDVI